VSRSRKERPETEALVYEMPELCAALKLSEDNVRELERSGRLISFQSGRRKVYPKAAVQLALLGVDVRKVFAEADAGELLAWITGENPPALRVAAGSWRGRRSHDRTEELSGLRALVSVQRGDARRRRARLDLRGTAGAGSGGAVTEGATDRLSPRPQSLTLLPIGERNCSI
jgi:hypothetical protein